MHVRGVIIGGIVASLVIGMWEMVIEALVPDGAGFSVPSSPSEQPSFAISRARVTRFQSTESRSISVWRPHTIHAFQTVARVLGTAFVNAHREVEAPVPVGGSA